MSGRSVAGPFRLRAEATAPMRIALQKHCVRGRCGKVGAGIRHFCTYVAGRSWLTRRLRAQAAPNRTQRRPAASSAGWRSCTFSCRCPWWFSCFPKRSPDSSWKGWLTDAVTFALSMPESSNAVPDAKNRRKSQANASTAPDEVSDKGPLSLNSPWTKSFLLSVTA